jgi:hypothetical protein
VTFATPWFGLLGLVGLVPLALALERLRTGAALRAELGLAAPGRLRRAARPLGIVGLFAVVAVTATQPALRSQQERVARSDAQIFLVIDNSRSMLASRGPNGVPRYARALAFARRLHAAQPEVPIGIGALTNRVLPYLMATSQEQAFQVVLSDAYGIERPPPEATIGAVISTLAALDDVAQHDFFPASAHKRVLVVLSDAETLPFNVRPVLRDLRRVHVTPILVRFWRPDERVYKPEGGIERYKPSVPDELARLQSVGLASYDETQFGEVRAAVQKAVGHGPTTRVALERLDQPIAPLVALAGLLPLLLLLAPLRGGRPQRRRGSMSHAPAPATLSGPVGHGVR